MLLFIRMGIEPISCLYLALARGLEPRTTRLFLKSPELNGTYLPVTSTVERSTIELGENTILTKSF